MNSILRDTKLKRDRSRSVIKVALFSRVVVLLLSLFSAAAVGEYDSSSQIIFSDYQVEGGGLYNLILFALRSLVKWDSIHFLNIAHKGYYFEQQFAFFPGLPLLVRGFSYVIYPFTYYFDELPRLVLSGLLLSNLSFILAAWVLYKLTRNLCEERFAWTTCLMFIFTPTPGFMSSIYTESFFALFTFAGIYFYHKKKFWYSSILWAAGATFRSNGMLFAGYFVYDFIFVFNWSLCSLRRRTVKAVITLGQIFLVTVPFICFQIYAYDKLCVGYSPEEQSSWCRDRLPLAYPYIQLRYWNCGFLKFIESSNIPMFLLAAPFLILSAGGIFFYAHSNWTRFLSIGLRKSKYINLEIQASTYPDAPNNPNNFLQDSLLPHIYLWLVLTVYNFTSMHVQVILRFFTSVPALYWFCAHVVLSENLFSQVVIYYWVIYGLISTTLFAGFFPPA